jgi:hypothetical protein
MTGVDPSTKYEKPRQDVGVFYCLMILIVFDSTRFNAMVYINDTYLGFGR